MEQTRRDYVLQEIWILVWLKFIVTLLYLDSWIYFNFNYIMIFLYIWIHLRKCKGFYERLLLLYFRVMMIMWHIICFVTWRDKGDIEVIQRGYHL